MTVRQIAEMTGKGERTILRKIHELLPSVKIENGIPVDLSEMETYRVIKALESSFHVEEPRQDDKVPRQSVKVSGALVRAMDSVYGKPGAAVRIDFLIGFPGASGGADSTSYPAPQPLSTRDGVALTIGRRVLDKQEREKKQGHLFPVGSEA